MSELSFEARSPKQLYFYGVHTGHNLLPYYRQMPFPRAGEGFVDMVVLNVSVAFGYAVTCKSQ